MAAPMSVSLAAVKAAPGGGIALGDRLFVVGGKSLLLLLLLLAVLMPLLAIFWRGFSGEAGQGGGLQAAAEQPATTFAGCSATAWRWLSAWR